MKGNERYLRSKKGSKRCPIEVFYNTCNMTVLSRRFKKKITTVREKGSSSGTTEQQKKEEEATKKREEESHILLQEVDQRLAKEPQ